VVLEAPMPCLLQRIQQRCAPGEQSITEDYLIDLRSRYETLWSTWSECPILRINNRDLNYATDPDDQHEVMRRIRAALSGNRTPDSPGSILDREEHPSLFSPGVQT